MIRLYGHGIGQSSFAQVTRGMQRALTYWSAFAGFFPVDGDPPDSPSGAMAPVSLNIGAPAGLMTAHRCGGHREHWLLVAPNAQHLPGQFARKLTEPSKELPRGLLDGGLLAPSRWAAGVLREAFPGLPVLTAPHGIDPDVYRPDLELRAAARRLYDDGEFRVLHMSSTEADRKGTQLLIEAWRQLRKRRLLPTRATLTIVMNPLECNRVSWWASSAGNAPEDVIVVPGLALSPERVVADLYSRAHVVCQPSRAEGFGMVPLEARACGVPVVATRVTGHSEGHLDGPGVIEIRAREDAPLDDYPGATAPAVAVEDIIEALVFAVVQWPKLHEAALEQSQFIRGEWTWEKRSAAAIARLTEGAHEGEGNNGTDRSST